MKAAPSRLGRTSSPSGRLWADGRRFTRFVLAQTGLAPERMTTRMTQVATVGKSKRKLLSARRAQALPSRRWRHDLLFHRRHGSRCGRTRVLHVEPTLKVIDLTGQVFGRLTVTGIASRRSGDIQWAALCRCGETTEVNGKSLRCGRTISCGCARRGIRNALSPPEVPGAKWIALTKGAFALVDEEDFQRVQESHWYFHKGYAAARIGNRIILMHRLLMPGDSDIDHQNRNGLDNRRSNLRFATGSQNLGNQKKRRDNSSGRKGVTWDRSRNRWMARVAQRYIGRFEDLTAASDAYDAAARKHF